MVSWFGLVVVYKEAPSPAPLLPSVAISLCSISSPKQIKMLVILFFLLGLMTNAMALSTCPNCGDLQVPYPLSTNENCGNPNYKVYCNNGSLELMSAAGNYYEVLSIDQSANKLVIKPPIIQKNTCYSSDFPQGGLLLDESLPFNISTHNTVMLFNCSDNILLSPLNCSVNSICRQFEEKVKEGSGCNDTLCCDFLKDSAMTSHRIRLRPGGCTAYTSLVDYKHDEPISAWNFGVELQWLPPN